MACSVAALTLGPSHSTVVLGAPIDLVFPVEPDPGMSLAEACLKARVIDGELQVGDSLVRVSPVPARAGHSPAVRVQAFAAAREPVLQVTLTAGCQGAVSRSYTFLAEPPLSARGLQAPIDVARLAPPVAAKTAAAAEAAAERSGRRAPARTKAQPQDGSAAPAAPAPKALRPAAPARKAAPLPPPPLPTVRERLVMEPLEFFSDTGATLHLSTTLALPPGEPDAAARAQALALWQALRAEPQELAAHMQAQAQVERLSADLAQAQSQGSQVRADLALAQAQLERMQEERFAPAVVYGLGGAVLLLAGLLGWSWRRGQQRQGQQQRAWRDSVAHAVALGQNSVPAQPSAPATVPATMPAPEPESAPAMASASVPLAQGSDESPTLPLPTALPSAQQPAPQRVQEQPPAATLSANQAALQLVNPEELFDILQQAEFFISVGEHEQAIAVLRQHIAERGASSPFSYLELLRLYHQLGRADDFELLRTQFMRRFNAELQPFARFADQGRNLLYYTDALAEIEEQWTSASVLGLLEGYLFLQEGQGASAPAFDLAAYDDLLLLLSIAQTTPASARGAPPPRQRTTPLGPPAAPALPEVQPAAPDWGQASSEPPQPVAAQTLDFLLDDLALEPYSRPAPLAAKPLSQAMLDVDLSAPPPITLNDLPDMAPTPAPAPGQAVGFGASDDKFELRFELEHKERPGPQL